MRLNRCRYIAFGSAHSGIRETAPSWLQYTIYVYIGTFSNITLCVPLQVYAVAHTPRLRHELRGSRGYMAKELCGINDTQYIGNDARRARASIIA